jgi:predicted NBD/HSP70 family sugar kinase
MVDARPGIQRERMNAILRAVLETPRATRGNLSSLLGLSPSSIVKYTKVLIDKGLIRESDREDSTGGRRSSVLELNPDAGLEIVIVLEATTVRGSLLDISGRALVEESTPSRQGVPREELLAAMFGLIDTLLSRASGYQRRILGIGIGLGGYIDPGEGISHEYLYARDWYDVPLRRLVEERYTVPCYLVNDANACALGEKYRGMGVGVDHFLCIWIGEGIGMGIVVNGELYQGKSSYAGEFGHVHAVDGGVLCYCGHSGCLETVCSQQSILSACCSGLRQGVNSEILKHCGGDSDNISIEHVIAAANDGDRFARNILAQAADTLGTKLSDVADLFNPELIILRGPVIDGNEFLFERVRGTVMDQSLRPTTRALRILYSTERKDVRFAGIGCAILMDYFSR